MIFKIYNCLHRSLHKTQRQEIAEKCTPLIRVRTGFLLKTLRSIIALPASLLRYEQLGSINNQCIIHSSIDKK